ncbi:pyridoxamine 5'-phosphate oxidase family protein, partial [Pseudomonadota bacterium]
RKELNATTLLSLPIETFSIKSRSGPPNDAAADIPTPVWAGVIPLKLAEGEPVNSPDMTQAIDLPAYLGGENR